MLSLVVISRLITVGDIVFTLAIRIMCVCMILSLCGHECTCVVNDVVCFVCCRHSPITRNTHLNHVVWVYHWLLLLACKIFNINTIIIISRLNFHSMFWSQTLHQCMVTQRFTHVSCFMRRMKALVFDRSELGWSENMGSLWSFVITRCWYSNKSLKLKHHTVDARNPAPPGMYKTLQITG